MRLVSSCRLVATLTLMLALAGCAGGIGRDGPPPPPSLYQRLGGQATLAVVTTDLVTDLKTDRRVARRFQGVNAQRFAEAFSEYLCSATGGPCQYKGRSMKDAHQGMRVTDAEFNAVVQDLRRALARHNVSVDLQVEVAAVLERLRDDIVPPPAVVGRRSS